MQIAWPVPSVKRPALSVLIVISIIPGGFGQKTAPLAQSGDKTIEAAGYLAQSGKDLECSPESARMWAKKASETLDGVRKPDKATQEIVGNLRAESNTKIAEAEKRLGDLTRTGNQTRNLFKQAELETAHSTLLSVDPKACYASLNDLRTKIEEGRQSASAIARQAAQLGGGRTNRKAVAKLYAKAEKINKEYRENLAYSKDTAVAVGNTRNVTPGLSPPSSGGIAGPTLAELRTHATTIVLKDATQVSLSLTKALSSANAKAGDTINFEVLEAVKVGEVVVIQRGALATGTVSVASKKKRMSRGGRLDVTIDFVQLVDGEKAPLRGVKESKAKGHAKALVISTIFIGPLSLLEHGREAAMPKDAQITGYINGDFKLESQRFVAVAAGSDPSSTLSRTLPFSPAQAIRTVATRNAESPTTLSTPALTIATGVSLAKLVESGDLTALRARLTSGANPNDPDDSISKGWTPLMEAAYYGNVAAARLLLDFGASVNVKTQFGKTALDIAISSGCSICSTRNGNVQVADLLRSRAKAPGSRP